MRRVINNGLVVDPSNGVFSKINIAIENGKISDLSSAKLIGDQVIDAKGLVVTPGFIDIHIHEDHYDESTNEFNVDIFNYMLNMGVTTAIGGNCGVGPENPDKYLEAVDNLGIPINCGLLVPHELLRLKVGEYNKYKSSTSENIFKMSELAREYIEQGCLGISFGIRYIPGITEEELTTICKVVKKHNKIIAAHIRDDAKNVKSAALELINVGMKLGVPIQVSHIGSMAAFGQMEEVLSLIDVYRAKGMDIMADCYPYDAFSTKIGGTTYDEGFLQRYELRDYGSIEIADGKHKGQRCSEELFRKLREKEPNTITIAHVMDKEEISIAMAHPRVIVASDGLMNNGQGHPRACGTFPRFISKYVREKKIINLYEAIEKITYLPARRFGLSDKGSLGIGKDADIVIFDYNTIEDKATFAEPTLVPRGIEYVLINGEIAVRENNIIRNNLGKAIRR